MLAPSDDAAVTSRGITGTRKKGISLIPGIERAVSMAAVKRNFESDPLPTFSEARHSSGLNLMDTNRLDCSDREETVWGSIRSSCARRAIRPSERQHPLLISV